MEGNQKTRQKITIRRGRKGKKMDENLDVFAKKRKSKKVVRTILVTLLLLALFGTAFFLLSKYYFTVREITVQENVLYSSDQILAALEIPEGQSLVTVPYSRLARELEERFDYLTQVRLNVRLPHTIHVSFTVKMGEMNFALGRETFVVDKDLMVIAKETGTKIHTRCELITGGVNRCVVGEELAFFNDNEKEILSDLLAQLEQSEMLADTDYIDLTDKFDLRIGYHGRFDVVLGKNEDVFRKLAMMRQVEKELYDDDTGEVDLSDANTAFVRLYSK